MILLRFTKEFCLLLFICYFVILFGTLFSTKLMIVLAYVMNIFEVKVLLRLNYAVFRIYCTNTINTIIYPIFKGFLLRNRRTCPFIRPFVKNHW